MAKLLFAAGWSAVLLGLAVQSWRLGVAPTLASLGRGLAWSRDDGAAALPRAYHWLLLLAHAGGLAYLWRLAGRSYEAAIPLGLASASVLVLPQWLSLLRRGQLDATPLTALALPYAAALVAATRVLPAGSSRQALIGSLGLGAAGYAVLVQVQQRWGARAKALPPAALLVLSATGVWAAAEYLGSRTMGVTGSDPYCYAQMAVDFVRRGDPRHVFTLFPLIGNLNIPWWPIVHVGYYPPVDASSLGATVWPAGWPALLAVAYRLLGESGLYLGAPVAGLLSLVATAALALEVWPRERGGERWLGVALATFILATSAEQVLWLLVPMADVATQLFTVLAVWLALRAGRKRSWPAAALAGAALGMAYDIRHTQVFVVVALPLALYQGSERGRGWRLLAAAGAGAALVAAPDLWYHRLAFGSLWRPESPELNLIGFRHWWGNAWRMAGALAAWREFGLLVPLLAYGAWRLGREQRRAALVLLAWVAANAGTQFLYGPLRLRDLLAVVPALAVLSAYGVAGLIRALRAGRRLGGWAPGWAALAVALLLALRTGTVAGWPFRPGEVTFGYVTGEQRRAFDLLGQSIEKQAVVGTSLNSGAVELYTGRETFRPGDWTPVQLDLFISAMQKAGKPVYFLEDGNEHAAVIQRLGQEGRLEPVRTLQVPIYGDPARLSGMLYRLRTREAIAGPANSW